MTLRLPGWMQTAQFQVADLLMLDSRRYAGQLRPESTSWRLETHRRAESDLLDRRVVDASTGLEVRRRR